MWDWSGFRGTFGCLHVLLEVGLFFYSLIAVVLGEGTAFTWSFLMGIPLEVLARVLYHRATKRDYNRKDSYWSKKEENSEEI